MKVDVSAEVRELVARAARLPDGLEFLHQAPVEAVAVLLQVHPRVVDSTRACLAEEGGRVAVADLYARAVEARRRTT